MDSLIENCQDHTWNLWTAEATNKCEVCGAEEPADPDDVAEQHRLLAEIDDLDKEGK